MNGRITTKPPSGGLSSNDRFATQKFWSGRRDSNPRPRPWQGRALPLSYTRIREIGGDHAPATGRAMPNAHRECNSLRVVFERPNRPISERLRANQPETACERSPTSPIAAFGNPEGRLPSVLRSDSSHLPNQPRGGPGGFVTTGRVAIKGRPPFDEGPGAIDRGRSIRGIRPHLEPIEISGQTAT
jgi:hypothetical protein